MPGGEKNGGNTMKKHNRLFTTAVALALAATATVGMIGFASAAESNTVNVRVNGYMVNFPDQKPFVDENNRTLIPVRFVAEKLGANVSWNGNAAVIQKDGKTLELPIGSKDMTVTEAGGSSKTVTMDTEAALVHDRTMVPIRFVAEELGAWVGFSDAFYTVQISNDGLTREEIEEIHDLDVTKNWKVDSTKAAYVSGNTPFEDLCELGFHPYFEMDFAIQNPGDGTVYNSRTSPAEDAANLFVRFVRDELAKQFTSHELGVTATFRTDPSCICTNPASEYEDPWLIFGYLTLTADENANLEMYKNQHTTNGQNNFRNLRPGETCTYLLETNWHVKMGYSYPANGGIFDRTNGSSDFWG